MTQRQDFQKMESVKTNIVRQTQIQHGAIDLNSKGVIVQLHIMCLNPEGVYFYS